MSLPTYEDGVKLLVAAVQEAVEGEHDPSARTAAGLRGALAFLAADPPLAHLLLVEPLAASGPARSEYERSLERLAQALSSSQVDIAGSEGTRLLAGGLVSHLSGRVLAGEAERLPESYGLLIQYLLAPKPQPGSRGAAPPSGPLSATSVDGGS